MCLEEELAIPLGTRPLSVRECRKLLREGGLREDEMGDEEVRDLRDTLAALADLTITIQAGSHA